MSIDQFTRDAAYFQNMRDRAMMINAEDLDFQFNNLIDYLNTKIVPIINNFVQGQFIGVNNPALADSCLLNVGDGTTKWQKIDSNIFPDYSIPLSKFTHVAPFSVLTTSSNGDWAALPSNLDDNILFSRNARSATWRKVNTGDIADKTLIGSHIALGAIKIEHLEDELRRALFAAPILNENIAEAQIIEDNLQENSLTAEKIDPTLLTTRQNGISAWNFAWRNDSIENRHIADQVLIGGQGLDSVPTSNGPKYVCLQIRQFAPNTDDTDDDANYTFTSDNIIDESITDTLIGPTLGFGFYTRLLSEYQFENGAIEPRHIQDGSVWLSGIGLGSNRTNLIPASALDPVIRAKLGV